ncbi:hypothetical protein [Halococcus sp. PRR34]|uniref:hypothetical protein n=1 Tax=Halococcus sp. PRR34 TaxID=3020830 RepID=UPI0023611744|nr:hypothetical protein [Halococcus sp. PRR34]
MDIKHPAHELDRGVPSRATIGTDDYEIDEDGYLSIDDETTAVQAMDRLAATYGVAYTDDGEIEGESAPETPDASGEDTTEDEGEPDDGDDSTGSEGGESLSQDELQALDRDDLREKCRENDAVDVDAINLNQSDEMVAALLRAQTENVDSDDS